MLPLHQRSIERKAEVLIPTQHYLWPGIRRRSAHSRLLHLPKSPCTELNRDWWLHKPLRYHYATRGIERRGWYSKPKPVGHTGFSKPVRTPIRLRSPSMPLTASCDHTSDERNQARRNNSQQPPPRLLNSHNTKHRTKRHHKRGEQKQGCRRVNTLHTNPQRSWHTRNRTLVYELSARCTYHYAIRH